MTTENDAAVSAPSSTSPSSPEAPTSTRKRVLIGLALALGAVGAVWALYVADLRPDSLRGEVAPEAASRGRALLDEMAAAHGLSAYREHHALDVELRDTWNPMLGPMCPWPDNGQHLRLQIQTGGWDSKVTYIDGPEVGGARGIQSWRTYAHPRGGERTFEQEAQWIFMLPTIQYFVELPLRIAEAGVALDAGSVELDGKRYERVLATWESAEPSRSMDQYLLYIDPETHLLHRADFTIRDQGAQMVGAVTLGELREVGGVTLPFDHEIIAILPGGIEMGAHHIEVASAEFDTFEVSEVQPDPELIGRGEKPAI